MISNYKLKERFSKWQDESSEDMYIPEKYFSGNDVRVYIGDKEIISITSLSLQLRQQLKPIYGYKSYTYDAMAIGNRIIIGTFMIPFISKNYLKTLIRKDLREYDYKLNKQKKDYSINGNNIPQLINTSPNNIDNGSNGGGKLEEAAMQYLEKRFGYKKEIKQTTENIKKKSNSPAFFNSELEITEKDINDLKRNGFNIYIGYGKDTAKDIAENFYNNTFSFETDINSILNKGISKIQSVYLRGLSQNVTIDNLVYESYEFIAKDIY
jgi:hypothetical protein